MEDLLTVPTAVNDARERLKQAVLVMAAILLVCWVVASIEKRR